MVSSTCKNLCDIFLILTVDCGTLTDPANGQVNHTAGTTYEQNATYSCNTGYNLVGNRTRTCQATGNWSGSEPTCQGVLLKDDLTLLIYTYIIVSCKYAPPLFCNLSLNTKHREGLYTRDATISVAITPFLLGVKSLSVGSGDQMRDVAEREVERCSQC